MYLNVQYMHDLRNSLLLLNSLSPNSDWHLLSSTIFNKIQTIIQITIVKGLITSASSGWLGSEFCIRLLGE